MPRASQHRALAYKQTKIKHGVALGVTVLITNSPELFPES